MHDSNHIIGVKAGAMHRYGRQVPTPTRRGARVFKRAAQRLVAMWPEVRSMPDVAEYYDNLRERRGLGYVQMLQAAQEEKPDYSFLRDRKHESFQKQEAYDEPKYPRSIHGPLLHVRPRFGEGIHAAERAVFEPKIHELAKLKVLFVKDLPVAERPLAIDDFLIPGHEVIVTDHTAFEAHMTRRVMMTCELLYLEKMLRAAWGNVFDDFVKYVTSTQVCAYKGFVLRMPAFRCSGNPDTSLSNAFENITVAFAIGMLLGNPLIRIVVEGDDALMQFERPFGDDVNRIISAGEELGFEIKPEVHQRAGDAGFCQLFWSEDHTLCPDITKKLVKLQWSHSRQMHGGPATTRALLRAKLFSLGCEAKGCPMLSGVVKRGLDVLGPGPATYDPDDWYKRLSLGVFKGVTSPTDVSRAFVERKWGITVQAQLAFESAVSRWDCVQPVDDFFKLMLVEGTQFDHDGIVSFASGEHTVRDW